MGRRSPDQILAGGCMEGIAVYEGFRGTRDYRDRDLLRTSSQLGRTCLHILKGKQSKPPKEELGRFHHLLQRIIEEKELSEAEDRRAKLFKISAAFIGKQHLHRAPERLRKQYHAETVSQLDELLNKMHDTTLKRKHPVYLGEVCELTTTGLINYRRSTDYMAIAALPHHDSPGSRKSVNSFDALFVPAEGDPQALQIKRACFNYCDKPELSRPKKEHGNYHSNIAIISGHCDLGIRRTNKDLQIYDLGVPQALVDLELRPESVSAEQQQELDLRADRLIEVIINEGRSSRAGIAA